MTTSIKQSLIGVFVFLSSCATTMSPIEVNNMLPTLTKSKFYSLAQAESLNTTGKCRYLVKNRKYVAPVGLSTREDLKNGAEGIDEWVKLDGGNAYVLKNYQWIIYKDNGSTQLHIEFDTMICE